MTRRPASTTETDKLVALVPVELLQRLKDVAEKHDRTISAEVRRAIRAYLDEDERAA